MQQHRVMHQNGDKEEDAGEEHHFVIHLIVEHHIRLDAVVELQEEGAGDD